MIDVIRNFQRLLSQVAMCLNKEKQSEILFDNVIKWLKYCISL